MAVSGRLNYVLQASGFAALSHINGIVRASQSNAFNRFDEWRRNPAGKFEGSSGLVSDPRPGCDCRVTRGSPEMPERMAIQKQEPNDRKGKSRKD